MKQLDILQAIDILCAAAEGHVVNNTVIKPIRVEADIPTFQIVFDEHGHSQTMVNPALPQADYEYYQAELEAAQSAIQT